jgi:prevent-host-death family protein
MKHVTAAAAQKNFHSVMERLYADQEPVTIVSDDEQAAVMVSMEDWNRIQETLYLQMFGMAELIHAAAAESLEDGTPAEEVDFGV